MEVERPSTDLHKLKSYFVYQWFEYYMKLTGIDLRTLPKVIDAPARAPPAAPVSATSSIFLRLRILFLRQ